MAKLSVMTMPLRIESDSIRYLVKAALIKKMKYMYEQSPKNIVYGGHPAVTRSLLEGLQKISSDFNYNPVHQKDIGASVVVLSDVECLKQAIQFKRAGIVNTLLAGPNIMVRSNEYDCILGSPEIDICLVPSDWVRIAYEEDLSALKGRIQCWSAGVDANYWKPPVRPYEGRQVLVYWKNEPEEFNLTIENLLKSKGWQPLRVVYGKYDNEEYKNLLSESKYAIFLSRSESQGIALAESWAMNIPTIVWNPREFIYEGRHYSPVSSCPFLTPFTGIEWRSLPELNSILNEIEIKLNIFKPRDWVLRNMTDEISAKLLIEMI